jgi:hypothetical protein
MAMAEQPDLTPPSADMDDDAIVAARAVLGAVPMLGAPLVAILTLVLGSPLEKRRHQWETNVWRFRKTTTS